MKRRILPIIMVICIIMTMLPAAALAAEGENVAAIGDTEYATLQEAIDAVESEGTITLLTDISGTQISDYSQMRFFAADKTITIDLNGKTVTANASEAINIYAPNLTLTIKNGTIVNRAAGDYSDGIYAFYESSDEQHQSNNLNLTLENVTLDSRTQGIAVQGLTSNSNVTLKSCIVTSDELGIYYPPKSGTLSIENTSITAPTGIVIKGSNVNISGNTTITANGEEVIPEDYYNGSTSGDNSLTLTGDAIYVESGYNDRDITLEITEGSFISENGRAVRMYIKEGEETEVQREISISGGTFSSDISEYMTDGVDLIANSDGSYSVGAVTAENAAAQVGDDYYGTLEEAIAAATDGQTVQMLKDLTISEKQTISTGITLDLGGHTLTIAGPDDDDSIYVAPGEDAEAAINVTIQNGTITDMRGQGKTALGRNTVFAQGLVNLTTRDLTVEAYAPADQASPYYNYLLRISPDQVGAGANAKVGTLTLASGTNLVELDNGEGETYGVVGISVIGPYSNANDMPDGYVGTTLVVEDGVSVETTGFAICGNGASHGTTITIEGGSLISNGSTGIYHPQSGTMTIDGDTVITGENAGVEIRAGEVTVNGGTISGLATPTETTSNGNGTTSSGAGIAVAQHTTKLPITLTINGGTINGYSALYESNPENNGEDDLKKVELSVVDGTFKATNGGTQAVYSADKTGFITGGSFSTDPSAYVADTYIAVAENGMYGITEAAANAAQVVAAAPAVDAAAGISSEVTTALAGTEADGLTGEANSVANDNTVTEEAGKDALEAADVPVAENQDVAIVVQPYLDIQVTAYEKTEDTTPNTMTLDITPMVRTVATTADPADEDAEIILTPEEGETQNAVQIGEAQELEISTPITLTIPLPSGFAASGTTVYIQHKGYEYQATVAESNGVLSVTFTNPHGFSEFTLSTKTAAVARIGDTSYTSLQAAVDAAADGDTIEVLRDGLTADADKTVTVQNDTADAITVTINGDAQEIAAGETHTFTYTAPSTGGSVTRYTVTVEDADNGSVKSSVSRASRGTTVTLTVTPDEGYELESITVTQNGGGTVSLTDKGDGKYTFTMPRANVTVEAVFTASGEQPSGLPFTDVDADDWFHDAVTYVYENNMMEGTGETTFAPTMELTRGMIAQVLYNLEGQPDVTAGAGFSDVADGAWYADAVNWAAAQGIVEGYGNGSFGPEDSITREQLAAILYRYAGYKGFDTTQGGMAVREFSDYDQISDWALEAMDWAVNAQVLSGKGNGVLDPLGTATRAEVAQVLMNFGENVQ